ncbi:homodimeric dihydroxyacetone kinase [Kaistia soli DSM 19436]|uniref:Homodimeric dihydroxyacetone kinase n=1 Tax=Kaistia soli DSM 19436 TaxID=1122133 RepID=A0A1M5I7T3_9HYPH|nr:dihydroxyacetone kinase subunit DhaL [Kaistia soli]SHG24335.1 homodimeric dihydroxyacetone kinase [Kaistia soli DSM 19436]
MKKLINSARDVVDDMLSGLAATNPSLAIIRDQRVVIRADIDEYKRRGRVCLISGGGSGHEPAHAGYIGEGMLAAAVCGEVFTSPSTEAVLAAIRAAASPAGVLLIVKNYTGDRLNFRLAAELARTEGIAVETVMVADDVALSDNGETAGRRGLAGTVLVHKVAGAAAARGMALADVKAVAEQVAERVGTFGVGLSACTVPAAGKPNFSLGESEVELGLGIHGEPGVRREEIRPVRDMVSDIVTKIASDRSIGAGMPVALLVNNLGATPPMEIAIATGEAIDAAKMLGLDVRRVWNGPLLTALDMAGISISLLALDDDLLALLDDPTDAPAWPGRGGIARTHPATIDLPEPSLSSELGGLSSADFSRVVDAVMLCLERAEDELTELDRLAGDGDLGANLARGAREVRAHFGELATLSPGAALLALSRIVGRSVGGTSGALYAAGLARAGATISRHGDQVAKSWATALRSGADAIADLGDAREGDRTMLDALLPACAALETALAGGRPITEALQRMTEAAETGAQSTAAIASRRGRASYIGQRAVGHPDAGAIAVSLWLAAIAAAAIPSKPH